MGTSASLCVPVTGNPEVDAAEFVGDSELIVRQVKGEYRVKDAGLRPLHAQATKALTGLGEWSIRAVRREQNAAADGLVNETLDAAGF